VDEGIAIGLRRGPQQGGEIFSSLLLLTLETSPSPHPCRYSIFSVSTCRRDLLGRRPFVVSIDSVLWCLSLTTHIALSSSNNILGQIFCRFNSLSASSSDSSSQYPLPTSFRCFDRLRALVFVLGNPHSLVFLGQHSFVVFDSLPECFLQRHLFSCFDSLSAS